MVDAGTLLFYSWKVQATHKFNTHKMLKKRLPKTLFWSIILILEFIREKQVLWEYLVTLQLTAPTVQAKIHKHVCFKFSLKIGLQQSGKEWLQKIRTDGFLEKNNTSSIVAVSSLTIVLKETFRCAFLHMQSKL